MGDSVRTLTLAQLAGADYASRITDLDMASEVTTLSKSQILSQSATAMLAQANSSPQMVLSLLR